MLTEVFSRPRIKGTVKLFEGHLASKGWNRITQYGPTHVHVNNKSPRHAIRVSHHGDPGFVLYAELCTRRPSRHFQHVYWHGYLEDGSHVSFLERLKKMKSRSLTRDQLVNLKNLLNIQFCTAARFDCGDEKELRDAGFSWNFISSLKMPSKNSRTLKRLFNSLEKDAPSLACAYRTLQRTALFLHRDDARFNHEDAYIELDISNLLIRSSNRTGQSHIVMADPYYCDGNSMISDPAGKISAKKRSIIANVFG